MPSQPITWFIKLAIARLRAQWRSILTIIIGVLLTTIIGASAPLYTSAIAQVGLEQRLSQHPVESVNLFTRLGTRVDVDNFPLHRSGFDQVIDDTLEQTLGSFGNWHDRTITWGESVTLNVVQDGEDMPDVMLRIAHYDDLADYSELIDGDWLDDAPVVDGIDAQIALSQVLAETLALKVGDVIVLEQRGWDSSLPITAQIHAIFTPENQLENYWLSPTPTRIERSGATIQSNIFVTRSTFDRILPAFIPQTRAQIGWRVLFNHNRLAYDNIIDARSAVSQLQNNIRSALETHTGEPTQIIYETDLANALGSYGGEVQRLGAPFTLFLSQLGALVLFFLVVMGELVRRNERREIGMLKARGVRDSQLLALRGMETLIICLLSVLVAPFIARQLLIGLMPLFTNVDSIPLEIRPDAFLYAGLAGLIALIVLVATLIPVLKSPLILTSGMSERSQGVAWWQRYYLDVILLVIGMGAFIQLGSTRDISTNNDQTLSDPLILLMPTLLIFALGSVSLRLFPLIVNFMAVILSRRTSLAGALAGWQVSREPSHYGRITFLLALAISMGWFALSFQNTVQISQSDRALYQVGSNVRFTYTGTGLDEIVQSFEGVQAVADVTRYGRISTSRGMFSLNQAEVLGVDSETLNEVIYWRPEWGEITIDDTADTFSQIGQPLPIIPEKIQLWAFFKSFTFINNEMQFRYDALLALNTPIGFIFNDDAGQVFVVPAIPPEPSLHLDALPLGIDQEQISLMTENGLQILEAPANDGWLLFEVDLSNILEDITGELRLQSINIYSPNSGLSLVQTQRSVYLRDLALVTNDEEIPLDWFSSNTWDFHNIHNIESRPIIPNLDTNPELLDHSLSIGWLGTSHKSVFSLTLDYPSVYTITANNASRPNDSDIVGIPAMISQSMADQQNITIGQNFEMLFNNYGVWFEAVAINNYFPTLYGDEAPFAVVDADALRYILTYIDGGIQRETPHELWARVDSSSDLDGLLNHLELQHDTPFTIIQTMRSETIQNTIQTDLLAVGLIGLLIFSAIIGFLLSLVSLLTYASLAVQARRTEFAVLRAMGFGTQRIIISMAIEQTFVIITSVLLGILIGLLLSTQVLPMLSIDTTGRALIPPFHVQVEPMLLVAYIGAILLILLIQLMISSLLVSRLTTTQALRQPSE